MKTQEIADKVCVELGGILSNQDISESMARIKITYFEDQVNNDFSLDTWLEIILIEIMEFRALHFGIQSVERLLTLGKEFDPSRVAVLVWTKAEHDTVVSFDLLCPNGKSLHFIVHPLHEPAVMEVAQLIKKQCDESGHVRVIESEVP